MKHQRQTWIRNQPHPHTTLIHFCESIYNKRLHFSLRDNMASYMSNANLKLVLCFCIVLFLNNGVIRTEHKIMITFVCADLDRLKLWPRMYPDAIKIYYSSYTFFPFLSASSCLYMVFDLCRYLCRALNYLKTTI